MVYAHRQQREVFHLLFLDRLLKQSDPRLFVLKGDLNLRFFFNSPRYSEDMDLDVLGGSVATLEKNGYRILEDRAFARSMAAFGIVELLVNDPTRAKHTRTTQRFRVRLVTSAGEAWPTKVECSRRASAGAFVNEAISPEIVRPYRRVAVHCQHYEGRAAALQKVGALADRAQPQVRDAFDLYLLLLGGHCDIDLAASLDSEVRSRAMESLVSFDYADYQGQVLDYLEPDARTRFTGTERWRELAEAVFGLLDH